MARMHDNTALLRARAAGIGLALVAFTTLGSLAGCSAQTQAASDATQETPASEEVATDEAEATPVVWAAECTDRRGDVTAYAVMELDGSQLQALLEEQRYVWSERNHMWIKEDGSSSLVVLDAKGQALSTERIAELGRGLDVQDVSYRLVTSGYSSVKRATNALLDNVLTVEDVEYADESGVAVAHDEAGGRLLVFVSTSNDTHVLSVLSEGAVAEGLFNVLADEQLGSTVDETFEALAGRTVATQE